MKLLWVSNIVKVVGSLSDYIFFLNFKRRNLIAFFTSVFVIMKKIFFQEIFQRKKDQSLDGSVWMDSSGSNPSE